MGRRPKDVRKRHNNEFYMMGPRPSGCRGGSGGALGICGSAMGRTKRNASLPAHEYVCTYHSGKIDRGAFHAQNRGFHTAVGRICWSLLFLAPPLQRHALSSFAQLQRPAWWLMTCEHIARTNTLTTISWIDTEHRDVATHKARATHMAIKLADNHTYCLLLPPCKKA